jgi:O-acetyl-ADP-ribose deacetylase (regulator of RNase III)
MAVIIHKGNLFNSKAQTIVNTVNCVGVMGKGIALVFKLRYPNMFDLYKDHCKNKLINPGTLWLYKGATNSPFVLNFPTKRHWKYPSKIKYLEDGLKKFVDTYQDKGITSIAFPLLGTHNGGLDKEMVLKLMVSYLSQCKIPIEIYEYDPASPDGLFENFKEKWNKIGSEEIKIGTGIRKDRIEMISHQLQSGKIQSMISLIKVDGVGIKTLEKCFAFVMGCCIFHRY